ncbi:MAG TPA: short chain dehydrogenase [Balneola sp.]|jgi:short-subunit dehydrogenase|nr:short chain dehydrogenase [Balneola sp.]MAO77562.1 short chain dehydrogenase [Balneola sp.]MBF63831.1 short chain dehydrogenase [Balneola sp.]HAH50614.1 short chain dehydrogenase [Balneola sp.]HBZ37903.1 short chain dehydrogenase [Balneola sp.]|tara:strand:+ start:7681 stop:8478 length:798 start_codon:yes stop_codon:yes gene_type:complete
MKYTNKTVWITGASSGIGEALAKAYFREGANLILSSRREDALEKVRATLDDDHSRIKILTLDLSLSDTFVTKTADALSLFGSIDVLVNNGGISQRSIFEETDLDTVRKIMEVNYFGSVGLTREVIPHMIAKKKGHIVVTSSVAGKIGTKYRTAYSGSKHAVQGFFDSLRQEMYEHNIAVTLICPGPIKTNITKNALTGDGSSFGKMGDMHDQAMDADEMVSKIWSRLVSKKDEIVVSGWKERMALIVKRISPKILNRILKNSKVV